MDGPVLFALLRDGRDWDGARTGLATGDAGGLSLGRVPALPPGSEIAQEPPFDLEPSGIASDGCGRIFFLAHATADRIAVELNECGFRYEMPFDTPAALALCGDTLYVADRGNARVLGFLSRRSSCAG